MATYHEGNAVVMEKAREVARALSSPLLGVSWTLDEPKTEEYNNGAFVRSGELGLHFYVGYHTKGRLEVSGCFNGLHSYRPYRSADREKCSITVSLDKSATAVAKDIERRLLPVYGKAYLEAKANRDADLARRKHVMDTLTELAALIPGASVRDEDKLDDNANSSRPWVTTYHNPYYDVHKLEVYGNEVKMDLRVSVELAKKLLKAINPSTGAEPPKEGDNG